MKVYQLVLTLFLPGMELPIEIRSSYVTQHEHEALRDLEMWAQTTKTVVPGHLTARMETKVEALNFDFEENEDLKQRILGYEKDTSILSAEVNRLRAEVADLYEEEECPRCGPT